MAPFPQGCHFYLKPKNRRSRCGSGKRAVPGITSLVITLLPRALRSLLPRSRRLLLSLLLLTGSCRGSLTEEPFPLLWAPDDSFKHRSMHLYSASSRAYPIKAWYVVIEPGIHSHVIISPADKLQSPVEMAQETQACVVINGGQFRNDYDPPRHVGLLKARGSVHEQAIPSVIWEDTRYYVARGAFGLTDANRPTIAWILGGRDQLQQVTELPRHRLGAPDAKLARQPASAPWLVVEAIGGGPVLVHNGQARVTASEEGFWAAGIGQPHPRTAIGYTRDERVILMVVDGRQEGSPGVNLAQLADMMANVGCVAAINLDGGGSSALVANGVLVNRPEGTHEARAVMSAIGIFCKLHVPPPGG